MPDDTISPRIMASTTVRPTIVAARSAPRTAHAPELTPGVSTVEQVQAAVVGAKLNGVKSRYPLDVLVPVPV